MASRTSRRLLAGWVVLLLFTGRAEALASLWLGPPLRRAPAPRACLPATPPPSSPLALAEKQQEGEKDHVSFIGEAEAGERAESLAFGIPIKWIVLPLLVLQNSATAMLVRQSRQPLPGGSPLYLGTTAVLASEMLKLPVCLALITRDEGGLRPMFRAVQRNVFVRWRDTAQLGVPALCYLLQNRLLFVALSRLSATGHQLWSQSKTLFTALFFVRILGQSILPVQWVALALLTVGVGLVQLGEISGAATSSAAAAAGGGVAASSLIGVGAVLASSVLSGFANIYLEKILKQAECETDAEGCEVPKARREPISLWMRNVQLGLFSIPQAAALLLADWGQVCEYGVFHGFTPLVWGVVASTAGGGLLVAAVVKHADNILKTFATATAIVFTCVFTSVITRTLPSARFLQGMTLVLCSLLTYNLGPDFLRKRGMGHGAE